MEMNVRKETRRNQTHVLPHYLSARNPNSPRATGLLCSFSYSQLTIYKRIYCLSVVTEKNHKVSIFFLFYLIFPLCQLSKKIKSFRKKIPSS